MGRPANPREPRVIYNLEQGSARFEGPGGFTEQAVTRDDAEAIAKVFGAPMEVREP